MAKQSTRTYKTPANVCRLKTCRRKFEPTHGKQAYCTMKCAREGSLIAKRAAAKRLREA